MTEEIYSWNEEEDSEYWNNGIFKTREEAISAGIEEAKEYGFDVFWLGVCEWCSIPEIDIDDIFDNLNERYYDSNDISSEFSLYDIKKRGEEDEDTKKLEADIRKLIKEYTDARLKNGGLCFRIIGTELIKV